MILRTILDRFYMKGIDMSLKCFLMFFYNAVGFTEHNV